jgi:hypothetical protein
VVAEDDLVSAVVDDEVAGGGEAEASIVPVANDLTVCSVEINAHVGSLS